MSGPKIFIAVLFLIALLFVISINLGAANQGNSTFQTPDWARILVFSQSLKISDLKSNPANCLQQEKIVVPMGGTCTFNIQQSSLVERSIALQLVQGSSANVVLTQEKTLPARQSLTNAGATTDAKKMKVYPGKAQGLLSVECLAGEASQCVFKLV